MRVLLATVLALLALAAPASADWTYPGQVEIEQRGIRKYIGAAEAYWNRSAPSLPRLHQIRVVYSAESLADVDTQTAIARGWAGRVWLLRYLAEIMSAPPGRYDWGDYQFACLVMIHEYGHAALGLGHEFAGDPARVMTDSPAWAWTIPECRSIGQWIRKGGHLRTKVGRLTRPR